MRHRHEFLLPHHSARGTLTLQDYLDLYSLLWLEVQMQLPAEAGRLYFDEVEPESILPGRFLMRFFANRGSWMSGSSWLRYLRSPAHCFKKARPRERQKTAETLS